MREALYNWTIFVGVQKCDPETNFGSSSSRRVLESVPVLPQSTTSATKMIFNQENVVPIPNLDLLTFLFGTRHSTRIFNYSNHPQTRSTAAPKKTLHSTPKLETPSDTSPNPKPES